MLLRSDFRTGAGWILAHPAQDQTNLLEATNPNTMPYTIENWGLVLYAYSEKCEEHRTLGCDTLVKYSE